VWQEKECCYNLLIFLFLALLLGYVQFSNLSGDAASTATSGKYERKKRVLTFIISS
jgi:hypothetical protein